MPSQLPLCRATELFIALLKKAERYPPPPHSLSVSLPLRSHCVLWNAPLLKCSYSPFRRRATFWTHSYHGNPYLHLKSAFKGGRGAKCTTCFGVVFLLASAENMGVRGNECGSSQLVKDDLVLFFCLNIFCCLERRAIMYLPVSACVCTFECLLANCLI